MRVEVLCEDRSSVPVMEAWVGDLLQARGLRDQCTVQVHAHRGKGYLPKDWQAPVRVESAGLLDLLPAKLRAYSAYQAKALSLSPERARATGYEAIFLVVVLDSDRDNVDDLYGRIESCVRKEGQGLIYTVAISVEEMESWLLGDLPALEQAFPDYDRKAYARYEQDSICGTWEQLCRVIEGPERAETLIPVGYPAIGSYKAAWAEAMAPYLTIAANRSPSFKLFVEHFERFVERAYEQAKVDFEHVG